MEGRSFADTINGQGVFFLIKYLTTSLKQSLYVAHMPKVSLLSFYGSVQSLSTPPMFVSMYSRPTSAPPSFPKLTRKHPNILASASQIYSPAAVSGWERLKEGGGGEKSPREWQALPRTWMGRCASDQGWSHAPGQVSSDGFWNKSRTKAD